MARCVWCGSESASDGKFCMRCGKPSGSAPIPGKCAQCGAINSIDVTRCTSCGSLMSEFSPESVPLDRYPTTDSWGHKLESSGQGAFPRSVEWRKDVAPAAFSTRTSTRLTAAAVLLIVAGLLTLLQGLVLFGMESYFVDEGVIDTTFLTCCGVVEILFGVGAAAGGYFTLKSSNYGLAVTGCLCAIAGFGLVAGTVLGIVALVLVVSRRSEFRR